MHRRDAAQSPACWDGRSRGFLNLVSGSNPGSASCQICDLGTVTSLNLSFLVCVMGIIKVLLC